MPRVIVKLRPGKSEQHRARLADKITKDVMDVFDYGEESASVGFEEIKSKDWKEKVCASFPARINRSRVERESQSGQVFDLTLPLDQVAEGYRAMDERRAIKALLRP